MNRVTDPSCCIETITGATPDPDKTSLCSDLLYLQSLNLHQSHHTSTTHRYHCFVKFHCEHGTGYRYQYRQSWNGDRRTCFVVIWKRFCFILSMGTKTWIDSVMHSRSSSRGHDTSASVTVTTTKTKIQHHHHHNQHNMSLHHYGASILQ